MSVEEKARRVISAILEHAAKPEAKRVQWWLRRPDDPAIDDAWVYNGPTLIIGVGPGVGMASWLGNDESYMTTGGVNAEPVLYEVDEWADSEYPAGAEYPIATMVAVIEEFATTGGRADVVEWRDYHPQEDRTIYKGQAAEQS